MEYMSDESHSTAPIRVLLADDHHILRQGLKLLLSLQQEIQTVGEARTGREAVDMVRYLQPDVVVMDITMPDMDGLEACRLIRSLYPLTQVLILTMHESEEYFLQALRVGAAGYLVKKAAPSDLHMAIHAVARYALPFATDLYRWQKMRLDARIEIVDNRFIQEACCELDETHEIFFA
jgi:DNA-binding NarL/FixJ family response regulator